MKKVNKKPKAIIYCRVANKNQISDTSSLEEQRNKCKDELGKGGYELLEVVSDNGCSANDMKRAGLCRLKDLVSRKDVSAIYISDYARLSRQPKHLLEILTYFEEEHSVNVVSIANPEDEHSSCYMLWAV